MQIMDVCENYDEVISPFIREAARMGRTIYTTYVIYNHKYVQKIIFK